MENGETVWKGKVTQRIDFTEILEILEPYPTFFHVLYDRNDKTWSIKIGDAQEAAFTSQDKNVCIEEAKKLCQQSESPRSMVVIRMKNNEIIERLSCYEES